MSSELGTNFIAYFNLGSPGLKIFFQFYKHRHPKTISMNLFRVRQLINSSDWMQRILIKHTFWIFIFFCPNLCRKLAWRVQVKCWSVFNRTRPSVLFKSHIKRDLRDIFLYFRFQVLSRGPFCWFNQIFPVHLEFSTSYPLAWIFSAVRC